MKKTVILTLFCLMLTGSGCGNNAQPVQTENPGIELPVIVHLETRNEVAAIMSGREGLAYTVTTKDGEMLVRHLSERELQAELPNIHRLLKTSHADDETSDVVWAGI